MHDQFLACSGVLSAVLVVGSPVGLPAAGQTPPPAAKTTVATKTVAGTKWRTPWGDPDLEGSWTNANTTPLQRPAKYAGRPLLTPEERAALDRQTDIGTDQRGATPEKDVEDAYNRFWWDRGHSDGRTSLIIDPPDGRIPPLTPEAQERLRAFRRAEQQTAESGSGGPADSWEDRNLYERCIIRAPLPRISTGYNNNYQIVQAPGYVTIFQEQMHETRVVPLDGRRHLDQNIRQWLGDSRGHWEGDTLVVDTTNFSDRTNFEGAGKNLHLIERWSRVGPDTLDYQFTVSDPTTWTRPWTAAWVWHAVGPLYEYACHEGNYGLKGILAGGRAQEKQQDRSK